MVELERDGTDVSLPLVPLYVDWALSLTSALERGDAEYEEGVVVVFDAVRLAGATKRW